MLKRDITYEDFNGKTVTETFYFNLSKPELVELEFEYDEGMSVMIQRIVDAENNKELLALFKKLVLLAYGEKSEDGKRFIKSDELREKFSQTAAYQTLFMELATDDKEAVRYLQGVLPKDLAGDIQNKPINPPVPPTS